MTMTELFTRITPHDLEDAPKAVLRKAAERLMADSQRLKRLDGWEVRQLKSGKPVELRNALRSTWTREERRAKELSDLQEQRRREEQAAAEADRQRALVEEAETARRSLEAFLIFVEDQARLMINRARAVKATQHCRLLDMEHQLDLTEIANLDATLIKADDDIFTDSFNDWLMFLEEKCEAGDRSARSHRRQPRRSHR